MTIILKNIPARIQKQDVKNFIIPIAQGGWFSRRGQIKSITLLVQKNLRTHIIEYHGLVDILPNSVAERVIKKLNRKIIAGKCIALCEYKTRNWHNDPRTNKPSHKLIRNRRIADRRDHYEIIVVENTPITSKQLFYDKGW